MASPLIFHISGRSGAGKSFLGRKLTQHFGDNIVVIVFPVDYHAFKEDYHERLKEAKKRKYMPKTQHEIIDFINTVNFD